MLLFLSHSGADTEAAQRLKAAILAHPAAKAAGLEVWLDVDELVAGQPWRPQLEDGLARATAFCVYIGGAGIVNWVDNEVDVALDRATGVGAIPFIPALAADTSDYDDLPPFVRRFQGVSDPLGDPQALADLIEGAVGGQVDVAPQAATTRPFVGLQPMREGDADRFFGRSDEVNALIAKVRRHPITAVVADSGAGKSSLVRAGLVPAFRGGRLAPEDDQAARDRTRIALVMRPGDDPLAGLRLAVDTATDRLGLGFADRVALRDGVQIQDPDKAAYALACTHPPDRTDVLLVVDQFEELLTQTAPDAAADFVALMLALAEPSVHRHVRIVLTVRNDYFNLISQYPGLADALAVEDGAAQLRLKALGPEALAEIVQRPLALAGHTNLDDQTALVAAIRNQVSDRPGDVALVQIALEATWDHHRQTGDTLLQSFTAVGGVRGALDTVAERERKDLSAEEQALLPALFVRLVRLGDSAGATRRPALLDDLDAQRRALAQKLAAPEQRRLLMTSETTAEVSHEALFRQWPWLQNHIQRNAEAIRTLGRFAEQAAAWVGSGHKWSALPNTADRQAFDALTKEHPGWPTEPEKKMLARAKTKWALMMTGLGGVMAAVAVSAVLAVIFQQKAAESARIAEERLIAETKAREDADFALQQANEARVLQTKILEELSETQVISVEARIDAERNASGALAALARIEATKAKPDPVVAAKLALASWPKSSPTTLPQIRDVPATLSRTTPRLLSRPWEIKPAYRHVGGQFSATGRHLALTRKGPMRLIDTFADKVLAEIELYPY
ncbi:MAG: TIR domain-containing protein, partial [Pseudomonadota bacterium]